MTIADTAAALDANKVLAAWRPLHELVGLSAIRGEVEYQRMLRLTNLLLDQRFLMEQGGLRQEDLKDCAPQG